MTTIVTARLVLRPCTSADTDAVVDGLSDFAVARNLARVPYPYHMSDAADFLAFVERADTGSLFCAIALKPEPARLRGIISYEWSDVRQDAELGYWYERSLWGQGFATEAGHALVEHAFDVARHPTLVSGYHDDNPASGRVLEKLGFAITGHGSEYSRSQGRDVPSTRTRLSRGEWLQHRLRRQNTIRT